MTKINKLARELLSYLTSNRHARKMLPTLYDEYLYAMMVIFTEEYYRRTKVNTVPNIEDIRKQYIDEHYTE